MPAQTATSQDPSVPTRWLGRWSEWRSGQINRSPGGGARLEWFIRQNDGKIPKPRRESEFAALTDDEAKRIEEIYSEVFGNDRELQTERQ